MTHRSDDWLIANERNTARFFTENRHIAWMTLVATVVWGTFGYLRMPQRKDPDIPVKAAMALCNWPGVSAPRVEQLVTRRIEETIAENVKVKELTSTTRLGVAFVWVTLKEEVDDPAKEFDDIKLRLDDIRDLPDGAGPITFIRDFGSNAALMLTVASPKVSDVLISLKARAIEAAVRRARPTGADSISHAALVFNVPPSIDEPLLRRLLDMFMATATADGTYREARGLIGPGFVGVDGVTTLDDAELSAYTRVFVERYLRASEVHPDAWPAVVIRDPAETRARLSAAAGDKYTYRELDDYTDLIRRTLQTIPNVTKVDRAGLLDEQVLLSFSQERLASYNLAPAKLSDLLSARNIPVRGGWLDVQGKTVALSPTGEFTNEREIGDVIVGMSHGTPVYLRDLVDIVRTYQSPARFLNFFTWRDAQGNFQRNRAVTIGVQMRSGAKIGEFGVAVDSALALLRDRLPEDLIMARTSDEPRQVEEKVALFMDSLIEAIVLVVIIGLIGFWEWRSALVLACSIPLTLAMTFGMMSLLGLDVQQISIASLIIALGLLVDDPVVASDAIKRDLAIGHPPSIAAWLGPTKLATAIVFATITNIVAYLPFLILSGDTGRFLFSLPMVLTASLVSSRIVSMTFIPLLGYYLLRPGKKPERPISERRHLGFAGRYYKVGRWAIEHRKLVFAGSLVVLLLGGVIGKALKPQFMPKDLAYHSIVDVWLPEDATITATAEAALRAEAIVRDVAAEFGKKHGHGAAPILKSMTTFVGGGGPRFWQSLSPEPRQTNYAQIVIEVYDKHLTRDFIDELQPALAGHIAGARLNAKQLEIGDVVGTPVSIRLSGDDMATLRSLAERLKNVFRAIPTADRVQDDWGVESFAVNLLVDPDRANLAGVTNVDVAASTAAALDGYQVGTLRQGDKQIPIIARVRAEERAQLADLQSLYVFSSQSSQKIPLRQISTLSYEMQPAKIAHRNQFRTIAVQCYPRLGSLPSEVLMAAMPQIKALERDLPPGFRLEIAGEYEKQKDGFGDLAVVLLTSVILIYIALVVQFRNTVKPLLVFAAIPYGMVGALLALFVMGEPFGFMGFLGIVSLVGVIVSHVIVLFDFIEEAHERGEPLHEALLDAGIVRLRPVLITVGATVLALFPLAAHGGPLWEPMCYAQIGGLTIATFVTLLLVPVLYAIFVEDLKIVKWETVKSH